MIAGRRRQTVKYAAHQIIYPGRMPHTVVGLILKTVLNAPVLRV